MKPQLIDNAALADMLDVAANEVRRRASMEGSIRWEFVVPPEGADVPAHHDMAVSAFFRTGNDMGQGGAVVLGDTGGPQPVDPWGPLRQVVEALTRQRLCPDCNGTGMMRTSRGTQHGIGVVDERCYCQDGVDEAYGRAQRAMRDQGLYLADMAAKGVDTAA